MEGWPPEKNGPSLAPVHKKLATPLPDTVVLYLICL